MKWLYKFFIHKVRVVALSEEGNTRIIGELAKIGGIDKFLELHRQAGYELYGKTDDKRWLGYVSLCETLLTGIDSHRKPVEEDQPSDNGYESTVE